MKKKSKHGNIRITANRKDQAGPKEFRKYFITTDKTELLFLKRLARSTTYRHYWRKKRYFSRFRIKAKLLSVAEFTEIGIIN